MRIKDVQPCYVGIIHLRCIMWTCKYVLHANHNKELILFCTIWFVKRHNSVWSRYIVHLFDLSKVTTLGITEFKRELIFYISKSVLFVNLTGNGDTSFRPKQLLVLKCNIVYQIKYPIFVLNIKLRMSLKNMLLTYSWSPSSVLDMSNK